MDRALDRSLDEILEERGSQGGRNRGSRKPRGPRREQPEYPRDGVRKSFRDDAPRNLDSEWVHDRYEDSGSRRSTHRRGPRIADEPLDEPVEHTRGTKIRVDNIHYELTQEDLEGLFEKIGPVVSLEMKYDRAGRSEGTAFVTYESHLDAKEAIREFNGANAAGQPIRLSLVPSGPLGGGRRNNAGASGRPLAERITVPGGRSRSLSPHRASDEEAARKGIDRYRPGSQARSRSPLPNRRREGGRRPGARRDGGGGGRRGGGSERSERPERTGGRTRKTQEELDAEMEDYFNNGDSSAGQAAPANGSGANEAPVDDIDMIE
ncbi:hypothetical protein QBC39DRAFT_304093 [Podospora conica]|nr:hypothetical protein QBC39DRAFT_304093 [Schizothecium conicum]